MTDDIANQSETVKEELFQMIRENTNSGQTILVIGVGNTIGVSQWKNLNESLLHVTLS